MPGAPPGPASGAPAGPCAGPGARLGEASRGDFLDVGHLGEGSVGRVTKVRHRPSGGVYALKAIGKRRIRDEGLEAQLLAEVRTQLTLTHPHLLRCYDYFEEEEHVFLVLEFADGGDLFRHLKSSGPLTQPDAAHVFAQVVEGLLHLHKHGIIHRDLKPENVLLHGDLDAKIADFGWCAVAQGRTTFCGTLCMLAPEMIAGRAYDESVDVWAAGVLLFEMLVGSSPFDRGGGLLETCGNIARGADGATLERAPSAARPLLRGLLEREPPRRWPLRQALAEPWAQRQRAARGATADAAAAPEAPAPAASPSPGPLLVPRTRASAGPPSPATAAVLPPAPAPGGAGPGADGAAAAAAGAAAGATGGTGGSSPSPASPREASAGSDGPGVRGPGAAAASAGDASPVPGERARDSRGGAASLPGAAPSLPEQLAMLGFTRDQALEAAKRTSSVEAAVEWILHEGISNQDGH